MNDTQTETTLVEPEAPQSTGSITTVDASQEYTLDRVDELENLLLDFPQIPVPVTHLFAPGLYVREMVHPGGVFSIGHRHKYGHVNFNLTGELSVMVGGKVHHIKAPAVFVAEPNTRKVVYCHTETRWASAHATEETDVDVLERVLIMKSDKRLAAQERSELMELSAALSEEGSPCRL